MHVYVTEPSAASPAQIQFTINQWLLQHGFSIGIGDLIADQVQRSGAWLLAAYSSSLRIQLHANLPLMTCQPSTSPPTCYLQRTMEIINDIMEKAKEDVKKLIEKVQVRAGRCMAL